VAGHNWLKTRPCLTFAVACFAQLSRSRAQTTSRLNRDGGASSYKPSLSKAAAAKLQENRFNSPSVEKHEKQAMVVSFLDKKDCFLSQSQLFSEKLRARLKLSALR